jgi:hypothetical protein
MADKKVTELSAITNASGDDLLLVVNDPSGTPTSNKITLGNLFANVVPTTVHKGRVTFRANTNYIGTASTFSANVTVSGILNVTGSKGIQIDGTTMLGGNGKLHANNTISTGTITGSMLATSYSTTATFNSALANTNLAIADRMQVANTTTLVNDRMQVANTITLVNDRIQVTNATSTFQTKADAIATNNALLLILNNPNQSVNDLTVQGNLSVTTSDFEPGSDPATSNAANEGIGQGRIFYSNTHLYIAVSNNTIKRVSLTAF